MNIIYLAGNSLNNKNWIKRVKMEFDKFSEGEILNYDHWESGEKWINLENESLKLTELVKNKKDYYIFAKSIGSVLALKGIYEGYLKPIKMVICGHPYRAITNKNYLRSLKIPTIFIQNEFDPVFSYGELEEVLKENKLTDYQLIKNPDNDTHDYEDLEKLSYFVRVPVKVM